MLARRSLATLVVASFALSATACSSLTHPDEITVRAEPAPTPAAPAPAADMPAPAAAPARGSIPSPGGGG